MASTRFCPTANSPHLHVGHIYLAKINIESAHSTGGRYLCRFDDNQAYWLERFGRERTHEFTLRMKDDLEWLGIVADAYSWESEEEQANIAFINFHAVRGGLDYMESGEYLGFPVPQIKTTDRPYPYVPRLIALGAAQDAREGVDLLIRGDDLVTSYSLDCYFRRLMGLPLVTHQFVPKLKHRTTPDGGLKDLSSPLSKTDGGFAIADYRTAGWKPESVVAMLAESCLIDPASGWTFDNVKPQPILEV